MASKTQKATDPDVVVMPLAEAKRLTQGVTGDFEAGYTAALMQLQDSLRQSKQLTAKALDTVITHIQDLIRRCSGCGGWLFSDGSCLTCERASNGK